ncbi:MAG: ATP-dependent DNA helicase, partial [Clostridia bacterium]|nr:ATP-dependent DNA helicase [Clostridia bacterium]
GDALSLLVIVKLPFAAPDPISDYEQTLYGDMDVYKARVLVPEMLIKLKQGFGRLIRTETDTGVCAILDSRAREGATYHDRMLAALPPCRVTSSVEAVRHFLSDRKPAAYFK